MSLPHYTHEHDVQEECQSSFHLSSTQSLSSFPVFSPESSEVTPNFLPPMEFSRPTNQPRNMPYTPSASLVPTWPSQSIPNHRSFQVSPHDMNSSPHAYTLPDASQQPGFLVPSQRGALMTDPSQLLPGTSQDPYRSLSHPASYSPRIKKEASVAELPSAFISSQYAPSYNNPYQLTPLPSEYTNPYVTRPDRHHVSQPSNSAMYMAPRARPFLPPAILNKARPSSINAISEHVNWSDWFWSKRPRTVLSLLYNRDILLRFLPYLGYLELIRLNSLNRHLYHSADVKAAAQARTEAEKTACIVYAENTFKQHFPRNVDKEIFPGNLGCYFCFRVLGVDSFEHHPWVTNPKPGKGGDKKGRGSKSDGDSAGSMAPPTADSPAPSSQSCGSRHSSVTLFSSDTSMYDSPDHSMAGSPPADVFFASGMRNPATPLPASSLLELPKARRKKGKNKREPTEVAELGESLCLKRIRLHQHRRRFCIACGVKNHFYSPGDLIDPQKYGEMRRKPAVLWVCKCYRLHSQLENPSCHDCGSSAPYNNPNRSR